MPRIETTDTKVKIAIGVLLAATLAFAWFGVRWQIGNMFAELTSPAQPGSDAIARYAVSLAPGDPLAAWLAASKERENFSSESIENSVRLFEETVRLSPYDFRWWIELGRAYEQAERFEEAENAIKRSIELAPEYTFPRWQYGNFLIRRGRVDEAFAELNKAAQKSSVYREQVFSLAWDYFGKDAAAVERIAGDAPDVRASLALFFAARGASAEALRNWNLLTPEQKAASDTLPRTIAMGLFSRRAFREAAEFARDSGIDPEARAEQMTNAGFEKFIGAAEETLFGWRVQRGEPRVDMTPDSAVKREGTRSFRITFKGFNKPEFYNVVQVVPVTPGASYRLTYWVRTENLRTGGPPFIQVANASDDTLITNGESFPEGTADWHQRTIEFTAPENCEGVYVRTARLICGPECPIVGTAWLDDFVIERK